MRRRRVLIAAIAFFLVLLAAVSLRSVRWRAELVALKIAGDLTSMSWSDVATALGPSSPYNTTALLRTRNAHLALRNKYDSPADIEQGAITFRKHCSVCHGAEAKGETGPDLTTGIFRNGSKDLQIFQNIQNGIEGTLMAGVELDDREVWRLVSFIRSISSVDRGMRPVKTAPSPEITPARLLSAADEPGDWLMYSGSYDSRRHSLLADIDIQTVRDLRVAWIRQLETRVDTKLETVPIVVGGTMYITEPPSTVRALDAASGEILWSVTRELPERIPACCGPVNRGLAILGNRLFKGSMDGHLVALDASTGEILWETEVGDYRTGHTITVAPLALENAIVVGVSGGEFGIRGYVDAYDPATGDRLWRFYTVPAPGEPGIETWEGDSWKQGGAPTWITGSYDPELNLLYWGVGNPGPPFKGTGRQGDNLYSNSVVALDASTGELRWHFQFTPHDTHDWDSNQVPVLTDLMIASEERKVILWANRNAFYYVLDRETGEFLVGTEYARQTWADGLDASGRPIARPEATPSDTGTLVYPASDGPTNWWSPAFSPATGLMYIPIVPVSASVFFANEVSYVPGTPFLASGESFPPEVEITAGIRALHAATGELAWDYAFPLPDGLAYSRLGGLLSTEGGLIFGAADDYFVAVDAQTGQELWHFNVGGEVVAAPVTYTVDGKQFVAVAAERAIVSFVLGAQ